MRWINLGLVLFCVLISGCRTTTPYKKWIGEHGGLMSGSAQDRAEQSLARLGATGRVYVVAARYLSAWSWPDGTIVVSRGLIDHCSNDELAAAIAHEIGHLVDNRHMSVKGLRGCSRKVRHDEEMHADAIGAELLVQQSIDASAMTDMLKRIADAEPAGSLCRRALLNRIAVLEANLGLTHARN